VEYGDIRKGPLAPPGTVQGIYASHVLEHLSLADFRAALANTYLMLASGGIFRLIVPDLFERARRYVSSAETSSDAAPSFLRSTFLGKESRPKGLQGLVREAIGNSSHLWMWDQCSLELELQKAGFTQIRRCDIGDSGDPMFDAVEERSRFYDEALDVRECAMEARKA
jgi:predicted SAM-dependent methyltransferase